jgi:hypothetical protein
VLCGGLIANNKKCFEVGDLIYTLKFKSIKFYAFTYILIKSKPVQNISLIPIRKNLKYELI